MTIFKLKQAKYEQTRLAFLKALISGFIKLLSKRYELNLTSTVSVSIGKVDTVFYFYFGLRMHKFEVNFINDCYFIHQVQMAGWIKK